MCLRTDMSFLLIQRNTHISICIHTHTHTHSHTHIHREKKCTGQKTKKKGPCTGQTKKIYGSGNRREEKRPMYGAKRQRRTRPVCWANGHSRGAARLLAVNGWCQLLWHGCPQRREEDFRPGRTHLERIDGFPES